MWYDRTRALYRRHLVADDKYALALRIITKSAKFFFLTISTCFLQLNCSSIVAPHKCRHNLQSEGAWQYFILYCIQNLKICIKISNLLLYCLNISAFFDYACNYHNPTFRLMTTRIWSKYKMFAMPI